MKNSNFLGELFGYISKVINGAEKSFLDLLSALVPYFVPIIPAYLTYYHTRDQMSFPNEVAWTAAFVVEVLGMTSISTAIRFYRNNQKYSTSQNKAPFGLAIFTYAFYLVVVLSVNVLLEVEAAKRAPVIILAIALFSLLSVPSGVLISIRSQYSEMLEDRESRKNSQQPSKGLQFIPMNLDVPFGEGREKLKKNCQSCGREFVTTYPNKKTCSDACRKRLSRDKSVDVS
jgi:hypothetical protein